MPVLSTISSNATVSPPDFTSLTSWESWAQGAPEGEDEYVAECVNDFPGGALNESVIIATWAANTSPTIRPKTPADGHQGVVGNGFTYISPTSNRGITNEVNNTTIQGITIKDGVSSVYSVTGKTGIIIDSVISIISGAGTRDNLYVNDQAVIKNCLVIGSGRFGLILNGAVEVENCTVVGNFTSGGYAAQAGSESIRNSVIANTGPCFLNATGTAINCASRDTSAFGTLPQTEVGDADFVNYTGDETGDYNPAPTSTKLVDTGTTPPVLTLDIAGNTRSDPDEIGAYAIAAAPATDFADTNPFTITIAAGGIDEMWVKEGVSFVTAKPYVNIGGVWTEVDAYVVDGGVWKPVYQK